MPTIAASEFQKNFGQYKEIAQREPVQITSNGRASVVLLSAVEYQHYLALSKKNQSVTDEFKQAADKFMNEHDKVLHGLAR